MEKRKIIIPIFNRATYGRMKVFLDEIEKCDYLECHLALGSTLNSQDYEMASEYIQHPGLKIHKLNDSIYDTSYYGITAHSASLLSHLSTLLKQENFDAMVVIGDRYETLSAATAGAFFHIPIVHVQGGEVTNNIDDRVRHAITKLSDYHMVSTALARRYVYEMGEPLKRIWNLGCPSLDLIKQNSIRRLLPKRTDPFFVIFHPETENPELAFNQTKEVAKASLDFATKYNIECQWYWPNNDPGREEVVRYLDELKMNMPKFFKKAKNTDPLTFYKKLAKVWMVVGNSSSTIRESSFIGTASICVGDRQGLRERSYNCITTTCDSEKIRDAMEHHYRSPRYPQYHLYGDGNASKKMVNHLISGELTKKPTLNYPTSPQYRDDHLGGNRFGRQKRLARQRA